jgi:hypothetical protein
MRKMDGGDEKTCRERRRGDEETRRRGDEETGKQSDGDGKARKDEAKKAKKGERKLTIVITTITISSGTLSGRARTSSGSGTLTSYITSRSTDTTHTTFPPSRFVSRPGCVERVKVGVCPCRGAGAGARKERRYVDTGLFWRRVEQTEWFQCVGRSTV